MLFYPNFNRGERIIFRNDVLSPFPTVAFPITTLPNMSHKSSIKISYSEGSASNANKECWKFRERNMREMQEVASSYSERQRVQTHLEELTRKANIREVAYSLHEKVKLQEIGRGYCLSCLNFLDLASTTDSSIHLIDIDRSKSLIVSSPAKQNLISNILKSLDDLRSVRHPYSKVVSQAEYSVAEAFAMIGQLEPARQHCQASIKVVFELTEFHFCNFNSCDPNGPLDFSEHPA